MQTPFQIAKDTYVLPFTMSIPGRGLLYLNSALIRGKQPMLVDCGAAVQRDEYLNAIFALVEPRDIRWIFVSHDDRDHSGNVVQLLELCPNARLVVNFQCATRLTKEYVLPIERLTFVDEYTALDIGDRKVVPVRPPIFDSPATRGLWDSKTRVFFSIDSFGCVVPQHTENAWDLDQAAYVSGFNWWNLANTPWLAFTDPQKMAHMVDRVRRLEPSIIVPYHGPVVQGQIDRVCTQLLSIPVDETIVFPSQDAFNSLYPESDSLSFLREAHEDH
jgi:flavorubredoxin